MRQLTSILVVIAAIVTACAEDEVPTNDLIKLAKQGDSRAQMTLAYRYRDGKNVTRDYAEAMRWAHLVADQGDAGAMDFVGWMYFEGLGVKRNPEVAAGYFKAAAGKSATAAWNLGQCLFAAQGVEQDVPKAIEMWKKAAVTSWDTGDLPPRQRWCTSPETASHPTRRKPTSSHNVLPS